MVVANSHRKDFRDMDGADYRAYLVTRNAVPTVYHSPDMHLKRLRVLARHAVSYFDAFLHRVIEALAAAKVRRIQRELMFKATYDCRTHGLDARSHDASERDRV